MEIVKNEERLAVVGAAIDKALSIPLVLQNIFQCMDWETVCECRQVSKVWYEYGQRHWWELAPPITLDKSQTCYERTQVLSKLPLNFDQEEEKYRWSGVLNYKIINIRWLELTKETVSSIAFINDRGHFITTLEILSCIFLCMDDLKDVVFCKNTPNLKTLKLTNIELWLSINDNIKGKDVVTETNNVNVVKVPSLTSLEIRYYFPNVWPIYWREFLSTYPNLKKLLVKDTSDAELGMVFKAVSKLCRANQLSSLTSVDLGTEWKHQIPLPLYNAVRAGFLAQLSSLSIPVYDKEDWVNVTNMLFCLADTLRHFKVTGSLAKENSSLKLPAYMPKLESVTLVRFHLKNFNFLKSTPNLKTCYVKEKKRLDDYHNIIRNTELPFGLCWPYMETFACNEVVPYGLADISCLQKWMPNLTRLKLHLNDSSFFAVCKKFPKLRRLQICHSKVTDYGYTGDRTCKPFNNLDLNLSRRPLMYLSEKKYQAKICEQYYEMKSSNCPYNAACLRDLEVLVIKKCQFQYGVSGLLSTAPYNKTFQYMPNLRKISIEEGVVNETWNEDYARDHGISLNTTDNPTTKCCSFFLE